MHISAYLNDIASVRVLIEYGADIKARTHDGNTPIILSADLLSAEITKCLMDLGEMLPNIPLDRKIIDSDGREKNAESFLRELGVDPQPANTLDQPSLGGLSHDLEE